MEMHYLPDYELYAPEPESSAVSPLLRLAYDYGMAKRRGFLIRHQACGRLLDVGCATGTFLRAVREAGGWETHGVEMSSAAVQIARERYGLDVSAGTLEAAAFPNEMFDAVTLWDVLEHLPDPAASLTEIWRILKAAGVLILRVPNGASWDAQWFGPYWAGLEPPRHTYVFTPQTLELLLVKSGFEILHRSSGSAAYTTFLLSLRFYWGEHGKWAARRLLPLLYHPVMRLASAPLFFLASLGLRGPQLIIAARKAG
jgi:SAM-dependent methyltransferase